MGSDVHDAPGDAGLQAQSGSMPAMRLRQAPFSAGEIIGERYCVERIIAQGGMGVIVAARHIQLDETVAIKFLKDEFAARPEIVGRFAREAKAAAKIKCEYTATVHDVGISIERGPYIVMEYLAGEDLESVLEADGRMPFARAAELMMQAGEALANAHAHGIIHRDIKPANLFLVRSEHQAIPVVKVLDFGVSKAALTGNVFGGAISLVKTQSLVGSPVYMSPEQLRSDEIGFTSDVWSLGTVLYELITGRTAFNGDTIPEVCAAILEVEPRPIAELAPDVPPGLAAATMRCLDKDPKKRWQSIAELVVALAPYAPNRASMSVDRAVAVSRSAGLIAGPPGPPPDVARRMDGADGARFERRSVPRILVETQAEETQTEHVSQSQQVTMPPSTISRRPELPVSRTDREKTIAAAQRARIVGLTLLGAALLTGAMYFVRLGTARSAPPPASERTAAATIPATAAAPAVPSTPSITTAAPEAPTTIASEPKPGTPVPKVALAPSPRAPNAWRPKKPGLDPSPPGSAPSLSPPLSPSPSLLPPVPPRTTNAVPSRPDQVRSAIDDRK